METGGSTLAKKAPRRRELVPKPQAEKTVQVWIDAELHRKLRVLASLWSTETTRLVDELIRKKIEDWFYEAVPGQRPTPDVKAGDAPETAGGSG